jgi:hypothetical protein
MTTVAITCTACDWREVALDSGRALADRIFRVPLRFNDETINVLRTGREALVRLYARPGARAFDH